MTPGTARVLVGCVAIVAVSGAAAYVLTDRQAVAPVPAVRHEAPPPPLPNSKVAAAPDGSSGATTSDNPASTNPGGATPQGPTLKFEPLVNSFSLVRDSAAYANASLSAPQLYPLAAGTGLMSASKSTDGAWIIAMTQDGQAAYIPAGDLGPYDASRAPAAPAGAAPVDGQLQGAAKVTNTATLVIDGKSVPLAGLLGKMGIFANQMQAEIDAHAPVTCAPSGTAYLCALADGTDIGTMALQAGQAETSPEANDAYREQEASARDAHRGLWR